jgi:hypothetical protein
LEGNASLPLNIYQTKLDTMTGKIKTLSQTDPAFSAVEGTIAEELASSAQAGLEREFAQRLVGKSLIANALASIFDVPTDEGLTEVMDALYPADLVLPTIYDDPISYSITAGLVDQIRSAATMLGFNQSGYCGRDRRKQ